MMVDNKPEGATSHMEAPMRIASERPAREPTKPIEEIKLADAKPKSKGFSNPALRAMGIPTLKLPSRNWMMFWAVIAAGTGGIIYDRYQQKQIRKKWVNRVAKFGEQPLDPHTLARKITVYIAPPPSDYLDESMAVFRRYVKPILNSAGVDFEIQSENRQGVIRSIVAAEIRSLRREIQENEKEANRIAESKKWYNRLRNWMTKKKGSTPEEEEEALVSKKFTDDMKLNTVLGIFYESQRRNKETINEDADIMDPTANGGVLCIGRGAYKEYLHGLHEGLLGPLEKPLEHKEMEDAKKGQEEIKTEKLKAEIPQSPVAQSLGDVEKKVAGTVAKSTENVTEKAKDTIEQPNSDEKLKKKKKEEEEKEEEEEQQQQQRDRGDGGEAAEENEHEHEEVFDKGEGEEGKKLNPIPRPFIAPEDYTHVELAPEFQFNNSTKIPTKNHVSPIFQQPILVIPVHHLLGFLNTPQRIYRFYTRRNISEEYGKATVALVENLRCPFKPEHVDWAKEEEKDWPKKWVEKGKAKNSEWTQDLITDKRVLSKLTVYDTDRVTKQNVEELRDFTCT